MEKEQIIEGASEKIINLEYELFSNIRLEVNKYTSKRKRSNNGRFMLVRLWWWNAYAL